MQPVLGPFRFILRERNFRELLGCLLLLGLVYSFVLPFFSLFCTREVGMSPVVFSVFMVVTALAAVGATTALARWSDTRCSRRTILFIGCASGALGYGLFAFVRDPLALFVIGCSILGVSTITFSQLFAYAREMIQRSSLPPSEAPLYLNVFRLSYALAWTAGPPLASWTLAKFGFRGTFLSAAGLYLALFVAVSFVVPHLPPAPRTRTSAPPLWRSLARPDLLAAFAGLALLFAAGTMNMLNLPLLVVESLGGTLREVGWVYSIAPAFELPLMFYFGLLASRGHQARLIRAGALIALFYYAGLFLVRAPWQIYPLQLLSAALISITSGVAISYFQDFLPDQPGTATNLFSSSSRLGAMIGYLAFGGFVPVTGHRGLYLVCTGLSALTAVVFFIRWRRTVPAAAGAPAGEPAPNPLVS